MLLLMVGVVFVLSCFFPLMQILLLVSVTHLLEALWCEVRQVWGIEGRVCVMCPGSLVESSFAEFPWLVSPSFFCFIFFF